MVDQQLRELERRWQVSGALEDEVAYLQQRLRLGELAEDRLELAAWVGHPAACVLRPQPPREHDAWVAAIVERWPDVVERVAFAAVWAEAPRWLLDDSARAREIRQVLEACAALIIDQSPAARDLLRRELAARQPYQQETRPQALARLLVDGSRGLSSILHDQDRLVLRAVGRDVGDHVLGLSDPVAARLDPLDELRERRGELEAPDARLLSLRARAGDLVPGALDVLQVLEYPPAVELLGAEGSLHALAERVGRLGRTRLTQLGLAAAEDRREAWERRHPDDPAYREGLEALRDCCHDRGPEPARRLTRRLEPLNEHAEPPWALLRAGLVVAARDVEAATRAAHGAVTWALAERVVLSGGDFDYTLARSVSGDRLDRLAPEVRERLGLPGVTTIFASKAASELLRALAAELTPLCLRSTSSRLSKGLDADAVEVVPVPLRWVDFLALDAQGAARRLVERVKAKDLPLKAVRTAAMLGSVPARGALAALQADPLEAPTDPQAWCDLIWVCGSQAWGHAVLAYLEEEAAALTDEGLGHWPRSVRAWLNGDARSYTLLKEEARDHVNGAGLRFGQPIDDCDYAPANPDDLRGLAVLSLTRARGLSYQRAAQVIGAPALRPLVAAATIPCVLGYTHTPGSACPPGTAVAAYDPARAFDVGTWLHHASHGLGVVVASDGATLDVQFDTVGRRRLRQGG